MTYHHAWTTIYVTNPNGPTSISDTISKEPVSDLHESRLVPARTLLEIKTRSQRDEFATKPNDFAPRRAGCSYYCCGVDLMNVLDYVDGCFVFFGTCVRTFVCVRVWLCIIIVFTKSIMNRRFCIGLINHGCYLN